MDNLHEQDQFVHFADITETTPDSLKIHQRLAVGFLSHVWPQKICLIPQIQKAQSQSRRHITMSCGLLARKNQPHAQQRMQLSRDAACVVVLKVRSLASVLGDCADSH